MSADLTPELVEEMFRYWPRPPYRAIPYDAVRGITWHIWDGDNICIALVYEEEAARLITARLNT